MKPLNVLVGFLLGMAAGAGVMAAIFVPREALLDRQWGTARQRWLDARAAGYINTDPFTGQAMASLPTTEPSATDIIDPNMAVNFRIASAAVFFERQTEPLPLTALGQTLARLKQDDPWQTAIVKFEAAGGVISTIDLVNELLTLGVKRIVLEPTGTR